MSQNSCLFRKISNWPRPSLTAVSWLPCFFPKIYIVGLHVKLKHWSKKHIILRHHFYWLQPVQSVDSHQDVNWNHILIYIYISSNTMVEVDKWNTGFFWWNTSRQQVFCFCSIEFLTNSWPTVQISTLWARLSLRFVEYQYLWIIPHADTSAFNQIHGGFMSNTSQEVQGLLAEERKRTQATEGALQIWRFLVVKSST